MTRLQRDSLYEQALQSLNLLGITNVPGLKQPRTDTTTYDKGAVVRFRCETCRSKGELEIRRGAYLSTRLINSKRDPEKRFPLTLHLSPGDYQLYYRERGSRKIQSSFTVKAEEENLVTVKPN